MLASGTAEKSLSIEGENQIQPNCNPASSKKKGTPGVGMIMMRTLPLVLAGLGLAQLDAVSGNTVNPNWNTIWVNGVCREVRVR
jgi:hypothetical protein